LTRTFVQLTQDLEQAFDKLSTMSAPSAGAAMSALGAPATDHGSSLGLRRSDPADADPRLPAPLRLEAVPCRYTPTCST
jgi:hypothetical protein